MSTRNFLCPQYSLLGSVLIHTFKTGGGLGIDGYRMTTDLRMTIVFVS